MRSCLLVTLVLLQNPQSFKAKYRVTVITGDALGAGTNALPCLSYNNGCSYSSRQSYSDAWNCCLYASFVLPETVALVRHL